MEAVMDNVKGLGKAKIGVLVGVAVLLLGFFMIMAFRFSSAGLAPLYSGLSLEDSAKIVAELDRTGTPYELVAGGTQIMAPADKVLRLRLTMAEQGLPAVGSVVGYEIFDRSESFGSSNFVMNVNMMRALEGELARTIGSLAGVDSARVHLVMPKRELFTRDKQEPSASVTIKMRGGKMLERQEVTAITHLVAAAVPGLEANRVTIVDNHGKLLARGEGKDGASAAASMAQEYQMAYENRTQQTLEELLEKVIGIGKVRVQVSADINFDRVVINTEKFDPEGQVARSVQSNTQKESLQDKQAKDSVTVGNNLPQGAGAGGDGTSSKKDSENSGETVNYEISKTVQNQVKEFGGLNRVSVAVLVDGTYPDNESGDPTYTPRGEEELKQLRALVASAIGYDEKRGDKLEVVNMRFTQDSLATDNTSFLDRYKLEFQSIIQTLIISVVAILALLLVLRPVATQLVRQMQTPSDRLASDMAALDSPLGINRLPGASNFGGGNAGGGNAAIDFSEGVSGEDALVDVANIKGGMKAGSMKKIVEIVEKYPEETMGVLRQWITKQA
jgi:flagellar M-ring protein FliF